MNNRLLQWAALAGLALACSRSPDAKDAQEAIAAAREANQAALATCSALEAERAHNAKLDAFCAELQTHANALDKLEPIADALGAAGAPAE